MSAPSLLVLSPNEYLPSRDDIYYLLEEKKDKIRDYGWEHEPDQAPITKPDTKPRTSHECWHTEESVKSIDSADVSYPYSTEFDSTDKASGEGIALALEEVEEINREEKVVFKGHVARFHVGEWGLMKGRSKESRQQAMEDMFTRVHTLAGKYRAEDEQERVRAEQRAAEAG